MPRILRLCHQNIGLYLTYEGSKLVFPCNLFKRFRSLYLTYEGSKPAIIVVLYCTVIGLYFNYQGLSNKNVEWKL